MEATGCVKVKNKVMHCFCSGGLDFFSNYKKMLSIEWQAWVWFDKLKESVLLEQWPWKIKWEIKLGMVKNEWFYKLHVMVSCGMYTTYVMHTTHL